MSSVEVITKSQKETQKVASLLAQEIRHTKRKGSFVVALEGELGAGKTTFAQGFAQALGIKENVLSPTFVLLKVYKISQRSKVKGQRLKHLVHIDCYRLDSPKDLSHLGLKDLLKDKDAVILIEWANRMKKMLPKSTIWASFECGADFQERRIKFNM